MIETVKLIQIIILMIVRDDFRQSKNQDNRSMIKITPWSMNLLAKLTSKYLVEYYADIRANFNLNLQAR